MNSLIAFGLSIFGTIYCVNAIASDLVISPIAVSQHFKREAVAGKRLNNVHPGAVIAYRYDDTHAIIGGVLRNSEDRTSAVAAYQYTPLVLGDGVRLGVTAGVATGYINWPVVAPVLCATLVARVSKHVEVVIAVSPTVRTAPGHITVFAGWVF
jgi:hypothetical protein